MFTGWNVLWQILVFALWQEEDTDDANEGTAGEDDMVEEVTFLVMEFHDGSCQHTEAGTGLDEAESTAPVETSTVLITNMILSLYYCCYHFSLFH